MPWLDTEKPTTPAGLHIERQKDGNVHLSWKESKDNDPDNAPMYVIYASDTYPVDITRPEHIVAQSVRDTTYTYTPLLPWESQKYFAVTAIDRYGNESAPCQEKP